MWGQRWLVIWYRGKRSHSAITMLIAFHIISYIGGESPSLTPNNRTEWNTPHVVIQHRIAIRTVSATGPNLAGTCDVVDVAELEMKNRWPTLPAQLRENSGQEVGHSASKAHHDNCNRILVDHLQCPFVRE